MTDEELERIERGLGGCYATCDRDVRALVSEVRRLRDRYEREPSRYERVLAEHDFARADAAEAEVRRLAAQLERCNGACDEAKRKADDHRRLYEESQAEVRRLQSALAEAERLREALPLEYRDGAWVHGDGDHDPDAVITYSSEPSPETGHVGWVWWARGNMGEASSLREAKRMAEGKLHR